MSDFTCFESVAKTLDRLPSIEERKDLALAVIMYGTRGQEPELQPYLYAIFEALRADIDHSVNARTKNSGGRPRKTEVSKPKNGGFATHETGVSEGENPGSENEKPYIDNIDKVILDNSDKDTKEDDSVPYSEIIEYLNECVGSSFKPTTEKTRRFIHARWREGFTLEDFKTVIKAQTSEWLTDPKMCKYLRPETLFGTKFEGYLNAAKRVKEEVSKFAKYDRKDV